MIADLPAGDFFNNIAPKLPFTAGPSTGRGGWNAEVWDLVVNGRVAPIAIG